MQIFVAMLSGKVYTLDVMPTVAVLEVKAIIDDDDDPIHSDQQQFFFDGQELDDNRTLASYGIVYRPVINLVAKGSSTSTQIHIITIFVTMLSGKVYTLDVMPTEAVLEVKAMIDDDDDDDPIHSDQQQFFLRRPRVGRQPHFGVVWHRR